MSDILASPFNKPECGNTPPGVMKDVLGGLINLQLVGTDPDYVGPITLGVNDYEPAAGHVNPDGTFFIIPETDAATYAVEFVDGTQFTITAVQSTAWLGQPIPMRLLKVFAAGTTGSFSVVY